MADVHKTAIVRGDVDLADDVHVGPWCVIDGTLGPVRVGAGTRMLGNDWLYGPLMVAAGNTIYPFCCLGFAPQSVECDPSNPGGGLTIGNHNIMREHFTAHRAVTDQGPTTIGNHNYFMSDTHVGHDCRVTNHCTIAQGAVIGGHVTIYEHATIGGAAAIHQSSQIGRGAMVGGGLPSPRDVPPFFTLTAKDVIGCINFIGVRRQKLAKDVVEDIRWAYRTLYRRRLPPSQALAQLKTRADRPMIAEYVEFIAKSKRGLSAGSVPSRRGAASGE